jgi:uracil-DNA glycosylase family 4
MTKTSIEDSTKRSRRLSAGPAQFERIQSGGNEPGHDCPLCPRLVDYRDANRAAHPVWFNAPVPTFGPQDARLLIVGLAPGLQGANRTGRPFTGDYAGDLLYATLVEYGFAKGHYDARPDDGLVLTDCRISNAVRCVPPQNKPLPAEIQTCRPFLTGLIEDMPALRAVVLLGRVSHESTLRALGLRLADVPFGHGAEFQTGRLRLFDSYHCSRYNTNTRRLTPEMFSAVFASVRSYLST